MFEMLDAIPVTFGPHEGDVWMIAATLMSFSASLVVAVVAARNAQRATRISEESVKIAKEANARDEEYRARARMDRIIEKRGEVALAISLALNAENYRTSPSLSDDAMRDEANVYANRVMLDALSKINLLETETERNKLRKWLIKELKALRALDRKNDAENRKHQTAREVASNKVAEWNAGNLSVEQF